MDARTVNFQQALKLIRSAIRSDVPIALQGAPGIGKSDMIGQIARLAGLELQTLILSIREPGDVGGFPVAQLGKDGQPSSLDFLPMGPVRAACERPSILFLDEFSTATPATQAAALRLVLDRYAGDRKLHPETRIVLALNPPQQAAGGHKVALPMLNRACFLELRTTINDFIAYLNVKAGIDAPGETTQGVTPYVDQTLRGMALDLALTLERKPDLLQIDPPPGAQAQGQPWASPRAWTQGLRLCADLISSGERELIDVKGEKKMNPILCAALAGCVGDSVAISYFVLRELRGQLPTPEEIAKDPETAKVPETFEHEIAAMSLLGQVALHRDLWAAWVYAQRLSPEIFLAMSRSLLKWTHAAGKQAKKSPWEAKGTRIRLKALQAAGAFIKGDAESADATLRKAI